MTDINEAAEKDLSSLPCTVVYYYPEDFETLPTVSYYTLTERGGFFSDNAEDVTEGTIEVDVWSENPKECGQIAAQVRGVMTLAGWTREFERDIPPESGRKPVFHRTIRFVKDFWN